MVEAHIQKVKKKKNEILKESKADKFATEESNDEGVLQQTVGRLSRVACHLPLEPITQVQVNGRERPNSP